MAIFTGSGVALVTPMKENQEVNYEKLEELLEFQIKNGTDSIIICGTTGESSTLTEEEHSNVIKACIDVVNKRIPVIAGTGSNCTRTAVELSKKAEQDGADGVLIVTPYYNKATQAGLKAHYTEIANSIKIPVIMYNVPSRTGCKLEASTIADLFNEVENITSIKEATGDIGFVADVMNYTDGKIALYSGNDDMIVPVLSLGGKGVISVLANIAPQQTHDMVASYLAGNVQESLAIQMKYLKVIRGLFSEVNPIPVKKAMNLMGMNVGSLRLPLTEMSEAKVAALEAEMKKVGLL
ncbi:MAG: 4-hydroxy-tetrahydrodipicolinate synthase [Clostridium sp.]|nr:4-hydroxy-tetrahydrodipicolinate synthase [Clostridium sp.]